MTVTSRIRQCLVVVATLLALVACTSLQLAGPYDPAIEAGLDQYMKSMSAFLKAQEQGQNSPTTLYSSQDSKAFYRQSEATLSNIVLHAEAASIRAQCAPDVAQALGLTQIVSTVSGSIDIQGLSDDDPRLAVTLQDGSCTVVALKAVRANNSILEAMHRKNGRLSPGAALLARSLLEDSIRIALRIEKAKKG